jgi:hypothetical protein
MNQEWVKNTGIVLAIVTALTSTAYNYGALNAEHKLNVEARAEQKIISENVIEMRAELKFLNQLVQEMRN